MVLRKRESPVIHQCGRRHKHRPPPRNQSGAVRRGVRWAAAPRILLEASTESHWVARHQESLCQVAIVADSNGGPVFVAEGLGGNPVRANVIVPGGLYVLLPVAMYISTLFTRARHSGENVGW